MRVLAGAYIRMTNVAEGEPRINLETFVSRVNDLDWSPDNRLWNGVMMVGSRIITGPTAMNSFTYVSYILGGAFEDYEEEQLKEALEGIGVNRLPERLTDYLWQFKHIFPCPKISSISKTSPFGLSGFFEARALAFLFS